LFGSTSFSSSTTVKSTFDVLLKVNAVSASGCVCTARRPDGACAALAAAGRRKVVDAFKESYPLDNTKAVHCARSVALSACVWTRHRNGTFTRPYGIHWLLEVLRVVRYTASVPFSLYTRKRWIQLAKRRGRNATQMYLKRTRPEKCSNDFPRRRKHRAPLPSTVYSKIL